MSKYTTEVRFICEQYCGLNESAPYPNVRDVIEQSRTKIFDFDFPIFDESYRSVLETKILKHYYMYEIGFETLSLFKFFLDTRLNEIMPYYNQLYKSELIKFDPLMDFDYSAQGNRTGSGNKDTQFGSKRDRNLTSTENRDMTESKEGNTNVSKNGTETETGNRDLTGHEAGEGSRKETMNNTANGTSNISGKDTHDNTVESNTTTNGTKWDYYHDTPQGSIETLDDKTYLTNARKLTDSTDVIYDGTDKGSLTRTEDGTTSSTEEGQKDEATKDDRSRTENETDSRQIDRTGTETGTNTSTGTENEQKKGNEAEAIVENNKGNEKFSTLDDYTDHRFGKSQGKSYSQMLQEFRETFLNIDMMIINDLNDLFLLLW